MKSIFLTILMFIVIFGALQLNILVLFDNNILPILAILLFVIVVGYSIYKFGFPSLEDIKSAYKINHSEKNKLKETKEEDDEIN